MSKHTLFLLVIVAIVFNPSQGRVALRRKTSQAEQFPRFNFLGTFPSTSTGPSKSAPRQSSLYFISQNAASWEISDGDCKAFLDDTASLVNIETEEELEIINEFIQNSDDIISEFWIGGKYDVVTASFIWKNGVPVRTWAPWDAGQPATRIPVTRMTGVGVGDLKFRTRFNTETLRYMCELPVGQC